MAQSNRAQRNYNGLRMSDNDSEYIPTPLVTNLMNKIGQKISSRVMMSNKGKVREIKLDQYGSHLHDKILNHIQHTSKQKKLVPLKKGCWDYHVLYANGMIYISPIQSAPS